jgi:glutathione S-transferase
MIVLYGFGAGFGLPEISPFVTKTEVQLKMAGLSYRKEKAMPPSSPKGQLPYIRDGEEAIADSTFIRTHIEGKYGFDFDAPLSLQARAQAWAFERSTMSTGRWSARAGSILTILPKGQRISSTARPSTCAKSCARMPSSASLKTI